MRARWNLSERRHSSYARRKFVSARQPDRRRNVQVPRVGQRCQNPYHVRFWYHCIHYSRHEGQHTCVDNRKEGGQIPLGPRLFTRLWSGRPGFTLRFANIVIAVARDVGVVFDDAGFGRRSHGLVWKAKGPASKGVKLIILDMWLVIRRRHGASTDLGPCKKNPGSRNVQHKGRDTKTISCAFFFFFPFFWI